MQPQSTIPFLFWTYFDGSGRRGNFTLLFLIRILSCLKDTIEGNFVRIFQILLLIDGFLEP